MEEVTDLSIKRNPDPNFPLTRPIVGVDFPSQLTFSDLLPIKQHVESYIQLQKKAGTIKRASFYLRDTTNAHWIGSGEDDLYHPASMLKVPIAMAVFKEAELRPSFLEEKLFFSGKTHNKVDQVQHLTSDRSYTVAELVQAMLVVSDNDAKDLLLKKVDPSVLMEALNDIGLNDSDGDNLTISARGYTGFFRTLYNSSFLTRGDSEKILEMLRQAEFTDGLVAGVPTSTPVAHKFGEYANVANIHAESLELHDCGIVYYTEAPYYACVMTEGYTREDLQEVIRHISTIMYSDFTSVKQ